jgi:NADH-quinone oxidoreductase subunit E
MAIAKLCAGPTDHIGLPEHCLRLESSMTTAPVNAPSRPEDRDLVDRIVGDQSGRPGALLGILAKLQERNPHQYLPMETLEYVAARTGIPQSQVYGVATFYALFNLDPQGTHTVAICRGTACHTRGSRALLERVKLQLNLQEVPDGVDKTTLTTPDRKFTIRTVACFGQCALAPVVEVDHAIRGHVKEQALIREVEALRRERVR